MKKLIPEITAISRNIFSSRHKVISPSTSVFPVEVPTRNMRFTNP